MIFYFKEAIRNVGPIDPHIGGFPETTSGSAHIIGINVVYYPTGCNGSSASKGADVAPFQGLEPGIQVV
jgi:hypothetical protein